MKKKKHHGFPVSPSKRYPLGRVHFFNTCRDRIRNTDWRYYIGEAGNWRWIREICESEDFPKVVLYWNGFSSARRRPTWNMFGGFVWILKKKKNYTRWLYYSDVFYVDTFTLWSFSSLRFHFFRKLARSSYFLVSN